MLSVSVMLMFLWYGFLAIGTYLLIMFFCTVGFHRHVNETINKSKYQDMWLLQHFGEEGRARFLAHDKMIGLWFTYCYPIWDSMTLKQSSYSRYGNRGQIAIPSGIA